MKKLVTMTAAGLACLGFASQALAAPRLVPANTAFTASGTFTVSVALVSLSCPMHLSGMTHDPNDSASISAAKFTGLGCLLVLEPGALPWGMKPTGATSANVIGMEVSATAIGICGPGNAAATTSGTSGQFTITNATLPGTILPCAVSSTFQTHPHLRILP
jgi:hypothetical protein